MSHEKNYQSVKYERFKKVIVFKGSKEDVLRNKTELDLEDGHIYFYSGLKRTKTKKSNNEEVYRFALYEINTSLPCKGSKLVFPESISDLPPISSVLTDTDLESRTSIFSNYSLNSVTGRLNQSTCEDQIITNVGIFNFRRELSSNFFAAGVTDKIFRDIYMKRSIFVRVSDNIRPCHLIFSRNVIYITDSGKVIALCQTCQNIKYINKIDTMQCSRKCLGTKCIKNISHMLMKYRNAYVYVPLQYYDSWIANMPFIPVIDMLPVLYSERPRGPFVFIPKTNYVYYSSCLCDSKLCYQRKDRNKIFQCGNKCIKGTKNTRCADLDIKIEHEELSEHDEI